ncbi:MAG: GtrA family protein [Muribaculaceae bacterium]|nr:GtrA family protein [Muribaculaceae bacterium]
MQLNSDSSLIQFIKYGIVGAMNTMLTLGVIFLCKSCLGLNPYVSNGLGYAIGLINSFIWNRRWVFKADGSLSRHALYFLLGFAICYAVQLLVVWLLNKSAFGDLRVDVMGMVISGYGLATLIGNVVYTICNFIYNKVVVFVKK